MATKKPDQSEIYKKHMDNARQYFEMQLQSLSLSESAVEEQTLSELEDSLERLNDAIQNPDSFGVLRLKVTADANTIIVSSSSEAHLEVGALPILLERKKMVIDRINSLREEVRAQVGSKEIPEMGDVLSIIPTFPIPTPAKMQQYQCDIFVIMPFADDFTAVHTDIVKPLGEELNLVVKRGDDFFANHYIMDEVWFGIYFSQMVVADCTGRNPNVFYELGIAHTLGKPAVLLTQDVNDIPFDVAGRRFIEYEDKLSSLSKMKAELKNAIETILGKA